MSSNTPTGRKTKNRSLEAEDLFLSKATIASLAILVIGLACLVIPVLVGLPETWIRLTKEIASVLIPSGLIAAIYEFLLRRTFLKEMKEQLEAALLTAFGEIEELRAAGVVNIHRALKNDNIADQFSKASKSIKILQTWMGNYTLIHDSLEQAARSGRKIEILLLHPASPQASARSEDLGRLGQQDVSAEIEINLKQLNVLCSTNGFANIEVRLYWGTPIMTLYWYDDTCFMGLFWRKRAAIIKPQLEVRMTHSSYYGYEIEAHFNDLWNSADKIDLMKTIDFAALKAQVRQRH